jgi:hypothetical protein
MESRKQQARKLRSKYRARENTGMRAYIERIFTLRKTTAIWSSPGICDDAAANCRQFTANGDAHPFR